MSVEEETADELGRRGVEDKRDKLRDVAEGDKQVDTEINREPQDEKEKEEDDLENEEDPETCNAKDPRMERQAPRLEPNEEHVIRTRSWRISRRPDYN